jgi:hypothetical protein
VDARPLRQGIVCAFATIAVAAVTMVDPMHAARQPSPKDGVDAAAD